MECFLSTKFTPQLELERRRNGIRSAFPPVQPRLRIPATDCPNRPTGTDGGVPHCLSGHSNPTPGSSIQERFEPVSIAFHKIHDFPYSTVPPVRYSAPAQRHGVLHYIRFRQSRASTYLVLSRPRRGSGNSSRVDILCFKSASLTRRATGSPAMAFMYSG